ncbi:MAG: hypothetical protein IPI35_27395 [Deltaproteobacteria bacterium]|nr:hypothetical protein [Deltaproteobacteria bacterium]
MRLTAPLVALPFVLFTACEGGATPPEQLEAATATPALTQEEFTDVSASGALQVSGEGQDLTLTVGEGEGALTVDVHSAGRSDLSALSGLNVTADLLAWGFESSRSLLLAGRGRPCVRAGRRVVPRRGERGPRRRAPALGRRGGHGQGRHLDLVLHQPDRQHRRR